MKFYMTPGSCSTGIHILLEEVGLVFEAHIVNLMAGENMRAEYLALNPNGTIPTLVCDDGHALTDFQTIAVWLAQAHPKRKLLPEDKADRDLVLDVMNYAVRTIHGKGFTRIFTTERFVGDGSTPESIRELGAEIIADSFAAVEEMLGDGPYLLGSQFTIGDAALFYVEFWSQRVKLPLPPKCQRHYQACLTRPAVRQVLAEEGYHSTLLGETNSTHA